MVALIANLTIVGCKKKNSSSNNAPAGNTGSGADQTCIPTGPGATNGGTAGSNAAGLYATGGPRIQDLNKIKASEPKYTHIAYEGSDHKELYIAWNDVSTGNASVNYGDYAEYSICPAKSTAKKPGNNCVVPIKKAFEFGGGRSSYDAFEPLPYPVGGNLDIFARVCVNPIRVTSGTKTVEAGSSCGPWKKRFFNHQQNANSQIGYALTQLRNQQSSGESLARQMIGAARSYVQSNPDQLMLAGGVHQSSESSNADTVFDSFARNILTNQSAVFHLSQDGVAYDLVSSTLAESMGQELVNSQKPVTGASFVALAENTFANAQPCNDQKQTPAPVNDPFAQANNNTGGGTTTPPPASPGSSIGDGTDPLGDGTGTGGDDVSGGATAGQGTDGAGQDALDALFGSDGGDGSDVTAGAGAGSGDGSDTSGSTTGVSAADANVEVTTSNTDITELLFGSDEPEGSSTPAVTASSSDFQKIDPGLITELKLAPKRTPNSLLTVSTRTAGSAITSKRGFDSEEGDNDETSGNFRFMFGITKYTGNLMQLRTYANTCWHVKGEVEPMQLIHDDCATVLERDLLDKQLFRLTAIKDETGGLMIRHGEDSCLQIAGNGNVNVTTCPDEEIGSISESFRFERVEKQKISSSQINFAREIKIESVDRVESGKPSFLRVETAEEAKARRLSGSTGRALIKEHLLYFDNTYQDTRKDEKGQLIETLTDSSFASDNDKYVFTVKTFDQHPEGVQLRTYGNLCITFMNTDDPAIDIVAADCKSPKDDGFDTQLISPEDLGDNYLLRIDRNKCFKVGPDENSLPGRTAAGAEGKYLTSNIQNCNNQQANADNTLKMSIRFTGGFVRQERQESGYEQVFTDKNTRAEFWGGIIGGSAAMFLGGVFLYNTIKPPKNTIEGIKGRPEFKNATDVRKVSGGFEVTMRPGDPPVKVNKYKNRTGKNIAGVAIGAALLIGGALAATYGGTKFKERSDDRNESIEDNESYYRVEYNLAGSPPEVKNAAKSMNNWKKDVLTLSDKIAEHHKKTSEQEEALLEMVRQSLK